MARTQKGMLWCVMFHAQEKALCSWSSQMVIRVRNEQIQVHRIAYLIVFPLGNTLGIFL